MKIKQIAQLSLLASALSFSSAQADMIYGIYAGGQGWQLDPSGGFGSASETNSDGIAFNYEKDTASSIYLALEHPIPIIPNVKIRQNTIKTKGDVKGDFTFGETPFTFSNAQTTLDFSNTDFIIYYEILDNDLVSIDLGLTGKSIDGSILAEGDNGGNVSTGDAGILDKNVGKEDFSGVIPMIYGAAEVGLPFTGLAVYGDISVISYDGHRLSDYQVGVAYDLVDNIAFDIAAQLGYRSFSLTLDDLEGINSDLDVKGAYLGLEIHF